MNNHFPDKNHNPNSPEEYFQQSQNTNKVQRFVSDILERVQFICSNKLKYIKKPSNQSLDSYDDPEIASKIRKNLTFWTSLLGPSALICTGFYFIPAKKPDCHINANTELCKTPSIPAGFLTQNRAKAYAINASQLKKGEFIFLDQNHTIIEKNQYPDAILQQEKQAHLDTNRKRLGKKYNIPASEETMPVIATITETDGTILETIQQNANQAVIGDEKGRTRKEYIQDIFQAVTGNTEVDAFIHTHIAGLIANESLYDNSLTSSADAFGMFQLVEKYTIKDLGLNPNRYTKDETQKSLIKQAEIAKRLMKRDFEILKPFAPQIAKQYFENDESKAYTLVIAPAVLNAYNAGGNQLKTILQSFLEKFPNQEAIAKHFNKEYTNNILNEDIFYFVTQYGKSPQFRSYKSEASNYIFKTMGMTLAMNGQAGNIETYQSPIIPVSGFDQRIYWLREKFGIQETPKTDQDTPTISRINPADFYKKGPEKDSKNLAGTFLTANNLPTRLLPTQIQPSVIDPWLHEFQEKLNLAKAKNKTEIQGESLPIIAPDFAFRLEGVGSEDDGEKLLKNNDSDYTKMLPGAIKDLKEIHYRLAQKLHQEANLSQNYTPTLTVTSVGRDEDYAHKHLHNSSKNSAHFYGLAFDLRLKGGEITHKESGNAIVLTENDEEIFHRFLRIVLDEMRQEGKIFVILEGNPPHFHIHSRLNDGNNQWTPPVPSKTMLHK